MADGPFGSANGSVWNVVFGYNGGLISGAALVAAACCIGYGLVLAPLFVAAEGTKGMVMRVFTLPGYPLVFKVIRDRFGAPLDAMAHRIAHQMQERVAAALENRLAVALKIAEDLMDQRSAMMPGPARWQEWRAEQHRRQS